MGGKKWKHRFWKEDWDKRASKENRRQISYRSLEENQEGQGQAGIIRESKFPVETQSQGRG